MNSIRLILSIRTCHLTHTLPDADDEPLDDAGNTAACQMVENRHWMDLEGGGTHPARLSSQRHRARPSCSRTGREDVNSTHSTLRGQEQPVLARRILITDPAASVPIWPAL